MKKIHLFILCILLSLGIVLNLAPLSFAGVQNIPGASELTTVSTGPISGTDSLDKLQTGGLKILHSAKVVISFLAVIFIVYAGTMMVVAMGDEKAISTQKRQLMYSLIAFLFVNIPGEIYALFARKQVSSVTQNLSGSYTDSVTSGSNIFINFFEWNATVELGILSFIRVGIIGAAVFMFTLAAFKLITSGGSEEKIKEAKGRILYGTLGLIFLAVIQGWVQVAYSGDIGRGQGIFAQLSNLALFFAGPTAIFFLLLGGYYYITSAGDDEKAKKGKSIVINTFIAVIILLASYAFLKDLADFRL
ncbi:MAG: hypothetical protein PHN60_02250 [Candidatus Gracilibacteria bacterium]|nr:hypothetical protein [Candidatus Gracilibacteria bacterium]